MKEENAIKEKSTKFAIRIIEMYKYLQSEKSETVMSKQLLRSGTGIGVNVSEGVCAEQE